ncbi:hypothetical protein [Sediminitomix flava]|nr:hypothetical protein [Sediminitomix flava]
MNNQIDINYRGYKVHKAENKYIIMQLINIPEKRYEVIQMADTLDEAKKIVDYMIASRYWKQAN